MNKDLLKEQLLLDEGEVLHAYQDSLGFWTIGVGRLIDARKGGGISHEEAMVLLDNDIADKVSALNARIPWWTALDDCRQRALADMAFNLGVDGLIQWPHFLAAMKRGDWQAAVGELRGTPWEGQVGDRAARIEKMILMGEG